MPHLRVEQPNHHFRNGKWKKLTGDFGNFYFGIFGKFSTGVDTGIGFNESGILYRALFNRYTFLIELLLDQFPDLLILVVIGYPLPE